MRRAPTSRQSRPSAAEAEELVRRRYGIEGHAEPLSGENRNFQVVSGGERFVVKIAAQGQTAADFACEHAAVEHLAARDIGLKLPRGVAALDGAWVTEFDAGRPARVSRWVAGQPWLAHPAPPPALLEAAGRCVAMVSLALADLAAPAARSPHRWTLTDAAAQQGGISRIDDPQRRRTVLDAFQLAAAATRGRVADLPRGWIHGDVNDENLLLDGDDLVGLIDFGDVGVDPLVCELAIAVTYLTLRSPDPLAAGSRIVAGYQEVRPLDAAEREVLFPLICGRLATSLAIAARRRDEGHDHAGYFVSEAPAWDLLAALMTVGPDDARRRLCGEAPEPSPAADTASLMSARRRTIGSSLSVAYDEPLAPVRGSGAYLYDHRGRPFLDLVNNVCHVGHCHPHVVAAGQRQMARLNTNTRYLYPLLTDYAARLAATLPDPLSVVFLVNSGSEANELALRLTRAHTGRRDLLVVEGAYHGHTTTLIDISPYKFLGRGGSGAPEPWVHVVPMPDGYRGPHRGQDRATGVAYGDAVGEVAAGAASSVGGLILESLLGCGGQVIPPPGFLETAYRHVRAAGGVCIADEVQVGLGRVGSHFWAFASQDVVPDIVVLGKPLGNGHPMAAVVTTPAIAASFANGMEFFSTFGGNPVSCAIGLAVLEVIESEGLQDHAAAVGGRFLAGLRRLGERHELVGDVRGLGLFLGLELVRDRTTLEPAAAAAARLVEGVRRRGVLLSTDGPLHNVVKIKPPMVLTEDDVDRALYALDDELAKVAP
jgi:4-aminobutyrate aminotransferase-like enzyme/Ser/Thr protein kinase RdoA (MazF antagonist)